MKLSEAMCLAIVVVSFARIALRLSGFRPSVKEVGQMGMYTILLMLLVWAVGEIGVLR